MSPELVFIGDFLARLISDPVDGADNAIKEFEKAFKDLRTSLQDIFSADLVRNTYQVVAMTKRIATIGLFEGLLISTLFLIFFYSGR